MSKVEIPDEKIIEAIEWCDEKGFTDEEVPLMVALYAQEQIELLNLDSVTQRSELFFAVLQWAKQADLLYPDEMLLEDFEDFNGKI